MRYVSTRGTAPELRFGDVLLAGLARDGGLYMPETWPAFSAGTIGQMAGKPYEDVAFTVLRAFIDAQDGIDDTRLRAMIAAAYENFSHPARTPLVQISPDTFILELFHGPTLAFKDMAMQLLAPLMDHVLGQRAQRITIVTATSGDTGGAAVNAFAGKDAVDLFVLHPHERVSPVQRRQMTAIAAQNVHNIAVQGTFDDCQAALKAMFNNPGLRAQLNLAGVNSINWARIAAQIVYYFVAATALGAPHRPMRFVVPSGNFGDIFAGYCARRMGLPVSRLIAATNENDILVRTIRDGVHERRAVIATSSPSMDIQISSNFERLLFEACKRDATYVEGLMASQVQSGTYQLDDEVLHAIQRDFSAVRVSEHDVARTIGQTLETSGYLLDPHTAVGVAARADANGVEGVPNIVLATAHPAKFAAAVEKATGFPPPMPPVLADLMGVAEQYTVVANEQKAIEAHILAHSRLV